LALACCGLLYHIGSRLFTPSVGLLAALMLAVYPPALHFSVQKIWSTYLFVFCLLLMLVQIWSLAHKPSWSQSLLTGVGFGFTSLVDPVFFAFWPFALLWFGWRGRADWRVRLQYGAGVVLVLAATLSPWLIRNYMVFDRFVFIKSNVGYILWVVNIPTSSKAEHTEVQGADEGRTEQFYQQRAFHQLWQQPWPFVRGVLQRGVDFWTLTKTKGQAAGVVTSVAFFFAGRRWPGGSGVELGQGTRGGIIDPGGVDAAVAILSPGVYLSALSLSSRSSPHDIRWLCDGTGYATCIARRWLPVPWMKELITNGVSLLETELSN
jgi:4-amino-4-deoxy-L-arabinose transferase-like glycosyltransferase